MYLRHKYFYLLSLCTQILPFYANLLSDTKNLSCHHDKRGANVCLERSGLQRKPKDQVGFL